jgi:hypothetical protein
MSTQPDRNQLRTELHPAVIPAFHRTATGPIFASTTRGLLSTAISKLPVHLVRHSEYLRSTCRRIIRANWRLTLSLPLTHAEKDWQTVSNSAVIAASCQAG